jgi:hypothetical protein
MRKIVFFKILKKQTPPERRAHDPCAEKGMGSKKGHYR